MTTTTYICWTSLVVAADDLVYFNITQVTSPTYKMMIHK